MIGEDPFSCIAIDYNKGEQQQEDREALVLNWLVACADEEGLMRLGLRVIEAFAQAEGRVLWH